MTAHCEYFDEWFSKSAFSNTDLKREFWRGVSVQAFETGNSVPRGWDSVCPEPSIVDARLLATWPGIEEIRRTNTLLYTVAPGKKWLLRFPAPLAPVRAKQKVTASKRFAVTGISSCPRGACQGAGNSPPVPGGRGNQDRTADFTRL